MNKDRIQPDYKFKKIIPSYGNLIAKFYGLMYKTLIKQSLNCKPLTSITLSSILKIINSESTYTVGRKDASE